LVGLQEKKHNAKYGKKRGHKKSQKGRKPPRSSEVKRLAGSAGRKSRDRSEQKKREGGTTQGGIGGANGGPPEGPSDRQRKKKKGPRGEEEKKPKRILTVGGGTGKEQYKGGKNDCFSSKPARREKERLWVKIKKTEKKTGMQKGKKKWEDATISD